MNSDGAKARADRLVLDQPGPPAATVRADPAKLAGIHGLRFLAAMMVIIFHLRDVAVVTPPFEFDRNLGSGVMLFFMISAFSLMYSTKLYRERDDWLVVYALKRFFRIAPLFYVMIAVSTVLGTMGHHGLPELALNLTFTFNFLTFSQGSMVWAGWTVGVEMIFYALLPLIIGTVKSLSASIVFLVIALIIAAATIAVPSEVNESPIPRLIIFPANLQFFAAGICVYYLYIHVETLSAKTKSCLAWALPIIFLAGCLGKTIPTDVLTREQNSLASIAAYGALILWQAWRPIPLLSNRFVVYWGERSYSIYLLHGLALIEGHHMWRNMQKYLAFPLDYIAIGLVSIALVLAISWMSYRLIERPGMRLGQNLWRKSGAAAAPVI